MDIWLLGQPKSNWRGCLFVWTHLQWVQELTLPSTVSLVFILDKAVTPAAYPVWCPQQLCSQNESRWSMCAQSILTSSEPLDRSCACVLLVHLGFLSSRETAGVPVPTEVGRTPKSPRNGPIPVLAVKARKSNWIWNTENRAKRKIKGFLAPW